MTVPKTPETAKADAAPTTEISAATEISAIQEISATDGLPSARPLPAAMAPAAPAPSVRAATPAPVSYSATGVYEIDDSAYELDSTLAISPGTDFVPGTDFAPGIDLAEVPPSPPAPPRAGFPPARPSALAPKPLSRSISHDAPHASPWRDLAAPLALILLGVVLCVCDAMYHGPDAPLSPLGPAIAAAAAQMGISAALVVAAAAVASLVGGVAFPDAPPTVALKMIAVSLAPGALASIAGHYLGNANGIEDINMGGVNGQICYSLLSVALFGALIWTLFRMHISDTVICVALIWIIRTGVLYFLFRMQAARAGSAI